ncbi:unnamed protein product, partial [Discosporangium mesarthrocarpum]
TVGAKAALVSEVLLVREAVTEGGEMLHGMEGGGGLARDENGVNARKAGEGVAPGGRHAAVEGGGHEERQVLVANELPVRPTSLGDALALECVDKTGAVGARPDFSAVPGEGTTGVGCTAGGVVSGDGGRGWQSPPVGGDGMSAATPQGDRPLRLEALTRFCNP